MYTYLMCTMLGDTGFRLLQTFLFPYHMVTPHNEAFYG